MTREERIRQITEAGKTNKYHKDTIDRLIREYNTATNGKSKVTCIKAFCTECVGYDSPVAENIRNCTDTSCPLYAVRPYR